ncbi:unnamed protein product [Brassica napus]|uniref:(rape) hypothetical protein n=1 Tax=Brassica napus TaxID=3708 RepID=A0A816XC09_BRANA|nr:unnamed protein product [Brassica napus]
MRDGSRPKDYRHKRSDTVPVNWVPLTVPSTNVKLEDRTGIRSMLRMYKLANRTRPIIPFIRTETEPDPNQNISSIRNRFIYLNILIIFRSNSRAKANNNQCTAFYWTLSKA